MLSLASCPSTQKICACPFVLSLARRQRVLTRTIRAGSDCNQRQVWRDSANVSSTERLELLPSDWFTNTELVVVPKPGSFSSASQIVLRSRENSNAASSGHRDLIYIIDEAERLRFLLLSRAMLLKKIRLFPRSSVKHCIANRI